MGEIFGSGTTHETVKKQKPERDGARSTYVMSASEEASLRGTGTLYNCK